MFHLQAPETKSHGVVRIIALLLQHEHSSVSRGTENDFAVTIN